MAYGSQLQPGSPARAGVLRGSGGGSLVPYGQRDNEDGTTATPPDQDVEDSIQAKYRAALDVDGYADPMSDASRGIAPPRGTTKAVRDSPSLLPSTDLESRRRWDNGDGRMGGMNGADRDRRPGALSLTTRDDDLAPPSNDPTAALQGKLAALSQARIGDTSLAQKNRGTVATIAHDSMRVTAFESEAMRAGEARREAELQRELLQCKGEIKDLKQQLKEADMRHREDVAKKLNEFRRMQREEEAEVSRELREVKSERSRLEQEVDLLRIQLADVQREAEQAKLDLDQQREKEIAELTERMDAATGERGEMEGQRVEVEKGKQTIRELKIENAKMRGRLAVMERSGARASADEIDSLKLEMDQLRRERDESEDELYRLKKDLTSIDRVKGEKMVGLEKEVESLTTKLEEFKLTMDAAQGDRSDRIAFLEAKICALQDTVRKLKDHRDKYMTALDIRDYDKFEEVELEVKKAKDDRREALALVDSLQQELRRLREVVAQDTRRKLGPGRDFDADIRKLVERTQQTARRRYGVPGGGAGDDVDEVPAPTGGGGNSAGAAAAPPAPTPPQRSAAADDMDEGA